jgi:DNA modification methylase
MRDKSHQPADLFTRSATPNPAWKTIKNSACFADADTALFHGDAQQELSKIPSESVNTCVTSPPYWGARDYGLDGQIGQEESLEEYVSRIRNVFSEVKRVLTEDGVAWLNLGDRYLHGIGTVNGRPPKTGYERNKQLALVPFRVAIALQDDGWWVRNINVWHKPNSMPTSAHDRFTNTWEPVFFLTKGEKYFFNLDSVRVPHKTDDTIELKRAASGNAQGKARGKPELRRWLNSPRHRATIEGLREIPRRPLAPKATELAAYLRSNLEQQGLSISYVARELEEPFERVRHYFRLDEIGSRLPPIETWPKLKELLSLDDRYDEAMSVVYGDNAFRNHPKGRNPGDLQNFSVARSSTGHYAVMPKDMARWFLSTSLKPGGICLDPFMGTGTSGMAAHELGGKFLGIDIAKEFLDDFYNTYLGK